MLFASWFFGFVWFFLFFCYAFKAIPACVTLSNKKEEIGEAMSCAQKLRRAERGCSSTPQGYRWVLLISRSINVYTWKC